MTYSELQKPISPKKNDLVINFTSRYLVPQFHYFPEQLLDRINATSWLAFGIADRKYPKYTEFDNKIFCLTTTTNVQYWLDNHEHYLYQDGEANKLMIVLDLPINNRSAFLEGRYSELYTEEERIDLIPEFQWLGNIQYINPAYGVITKSEWSRQIFQEKLSKDFAIPPADIEVSTEQEYEYPPVLTREVFNYTYSPPEETEYKITVDDVWD